MVHIVMERWFFDKGQPSQPLWDLKYYSLYVELSIKIYTNSRKIFEFTVAGSELSITNRDCANIRSWGKVGKWTVPDLRERFLQLHSRSTWHIVPGLQD